MKRILVALILITISLLVGTVGFAIIEEYSWLDAAYMTVITVSTVGFNEVNPLTASGRLFALIYILFNLGVFAYVVSVVTTYIFEGELQDLFKEYATDKKIKRLEEHVIVCGYGRNGMKACEELHKHRVNFLIIEKDVDALRTIPGIYGKVHVVGDASQDEVLRKARIDKAKAIITTLPRDSDNVFITLSAKELNPQVYVVSRASEENSETKLIRAGADKVIMPDAVGGAHMAQLITKPYVIEFLDILGGISDVDLQLEEIKCDELKSPFQGQTIAQMDIRKQTSATIVGLRRKTKGFLFNPSAQEPLNLGDIIILLGQKHDIEAFRKAYT